MKTEIVVSKPSIGDVGELARTLARAFQDDPALSWAAPSAAQRERSGPRYFELLLRRTYLPKGDVYMTGDRAGVALWAPPDKWRDPLTAALPFFPAMLRTCGRHLPRALRMLSMMEAKHKEHDEPHYYLAYIATHPDSQGKGYGTALLSSMLERCDTEGVPAYLEATCMRNQALYCRYGFSVIEELNWPDGGPTFWRMWRRPR